MEGKPPVRPRAGANRRDRGGVVPVSREIPGGSSPRNPPGNDFGYGTPRAIRLGCAPIYGTPEAVLARLYAHLWDA